MHISQSLFLTINERKLAGSRNKAEFVKGISSSLVGSAHGRSVSCHVKALQGFTTRLEREVYAKMSTRPLKARQYGVASRCVFCSMVGLLVQKCLDLIPWTVGFRSPCCGLLAGCEW